MNDLPVASMSPNSNSLGLGSAVDLVGGSKTGVYAGSLSLMGETMKTLEQMYLDSPSCMWAHLIHKPCCLKQVQISGFML